jgi:glutathione S-transferase
MKLYFVPGACSFAPHVIAHEAGIKIVPVQVGRDKKLPDGSDYRDINPKGYVPALALDDGALLTEAAVVLQYLADQKPEANLIPPTGTMARYRVLEWLTFISSELHKSFSPLFSPQTPDNVKAMTRELIAGRLGLVERALVDRAYLTGDQFTVADAYLFTVLRWTKPTNIDLSAWPGIQAFMTRTAARPAVLAAIEAEKLKR